MNKEPELNLLKKEEMPANTKKWKQKQLIKDLKFGQTFFTAVVALDLIYANLEAFFWSADDD